MKTADGQALVTAALGTLATIIKLDAMLERIHSQDDLVRAFNGLLWDQKVFSVFGADRTSWACEVSKDGPSLVVQSKRHDCDDKIVVSGSAFWKQLVAVLQARHPTLRLAGTESFMERVLHDSGIEGRLSELAPARQEDEAVREHRRRLRNLQRQKQDEFRETKAADHRYMYWLWYQ